MSKFDHLLLSPQFSHNPYPIYHLLRSEDPVYWSDAWGCWILTRYDDVVSTLHNPQLFSSFGRVTGIIQQELPEPLLEKIQPLIDHYSRGLINVDPPDHTRLRQLVHKAFTPRTIEKLRSHIQEIVDGLLDEVQDTGEMEVVRNLAYPLPVTVIAELMGVPVKERDRFKRWSGTIIEFQATPRPTPEVILRSQQALLELREYFRGIFAQRRRQPQEDLISKLVLVEEEGDKLTEEELLSTCVSILIGGHETTTNLIASGLLLLLQHPGEMQKLKDNPSLITTSVEEFLRYEGPFQRNGRIVQEDVELGGKQLRKRQRVTQLLGAANRDPAQFPDPDRLDIQRHPNRHVSFGYGPHFCVGAALARLEAPIAINTVLRRMPHLRLETEDIDWWDTVFRGPKAVRVSF